MGDYVPWDSIQRIHLVVLYFRATFRLWNFQREFQEAGSIRYGCTSTSLAAQIVYTTDNTITTLKVKTRLEYSAGNPQPLFSRLGSVLGIFTTYDQQHCGPIDELYTFELWWRQHWSIDDFLGGAAEQKHHTLFNVRRSEFGVTKMDFWRRFTVI